jgi:2-polyprenyl-6-methoxyphenol hydroxylase-like FAD-dependent oxidoreductase
VRVACVGAGPAGLYFSILMKLADPAHEVTVFERNPPDSTYGWGVVFWPDLLQRLYDCDRQSAAAIEAAAFRWVDEVIDVPGRPLTRIPGSGFAIKRQRLLDILAGRARDLGVVVGFGHEVDPARLPDADLVVACDGVSSGTRSASASFGTNVALGANKYVWLGTSKVFEAFTFPFVQTDAGWIWAHAYGFDTGSSTFIVECSEATWSALGFSQMTTAEGLATLGKLFARQLDGHPLQAPAQSGSGLWLNFRTVTNGRWHDGHLVLAGDSAHTTHFTLGSGTKLALEDAISLAANVSGQSSLPAALLAYEQERQAALRQLQFDARYSARWFENIPRYIGLSPAKFTVLLHERRAPLVSQLPPGLYFGLHWLTQHAAVIGKLRALAGRAAFRLPHQG